MKKNRILSMLLAAVMACSTLPIMASAAEKAPVSTKFGVNLLEDAEESLTGWTANGTSIAVKGEENTYVHVYDRKSNTAQTTFASKYTMEPGDYKYELRIRSYEVGANAQTRISHTSWGTKWIYTTINAADTQKWIDIKDEFTVAANTEFKLVFAGNGVEALAPFDIDDIVLYKKVGGAYTKVFGTDFEQYLENNAVSAAGIALGSNVKASIEKEDKYLSLTNFERNDKGANYTANMVLEPGVYEFSADFRMPAYDSTSVRSFIYNGNTQYFGSKHDVATCDICKDGGSQNGGDTRHHVIMEPGTSTNMNVTPTSSTQPYNTLWDRNGTATTLVQDNNFRGVRIKLNGLQSGYAEWTTAEHGLISDNKNFLLVEDDWTSGSFRVEVPAETTFSGILLMGSWNAWDCLPLDIDNVSFVKVAEADNGQLNVAGTTAYIPMSKVAGAALVDNDTVVEGNKFIRLYERNNNWAGLKFNASSVLTDDTKDYYLSFQFRSAAESHVQPDNAVLTFHSDAAGTGRLKNLSYNTNAATANDGSAGKYIKAYAPGVWYDVVIPYTQASYTVAQIASINMIGLYSGEQSTPIDFDAFEIFHMENGVKVVDWSEDFDDEANGALSSATSAMFGLKLNAGCTGKLAIEEDAPYYAVNSTAAVYTADGITLGTGDYVVKAEVSYPVYDTSKLTMDGNFITVDGNCFNAKLNVALADGTVYESEEAVRVGNAWTPIEIAFTVMEAVDLDSISILADADTKIRIRNFVIECDAFSVLGDAEDNALSGATAKAENGTMSYEEGYGYVTIAQRTEDPGTFLQIKLADNAKKDRTYYVSYDILAPNGHSYRNRVNVTNYLSDPTNGMYIWHTANSSLGKVAGTPADKANHFPWVTASASNEWQHFEGEFTPNVNGAAIEISISRGPGQFKNEFSIDNLKVWYNNDAGDPVVIYNNDFNNVGDIDSVITFSNAPAAHLQDITHTVITPDSADTATSLVYGLTIPEEEAVEGIYAYSADMRMSDGETEVTITYVYANGSENAFVTTVGEEWTTVKVFGQVTDSKLVEIVISYTSGAALNIANEDLLIDGRESGGIPNIGILMMLMKKGYGSNKLPDGYLHIAERTPETSNRFLTFNADATTKAGVKYYVSFDARTSDNAKTIIRPIVTFNIKESMKVADGGIKVDGMVSELGMNNKYVVPNDNTKFEVTWNGTGGENNQSYPCTYVTGKWAHFEGYFTAVEDGKAIQLVFERGPANTYVQPLDIDDVKIWYMDGETEVVVYERNFDSEGQNANITGTAEVSHVLPQNGGAGNGATTGTAEVEGNLFVNGDFDEAPAIVTGDQYNDAAVNTWFPMDGNGFEKDNNGVDIEDKPIYIPHKIEWTDGYITLSGRTNNVRAFQYASGQKLEAGNYVLSFKIKTAVAGETTQMRTSVNGYKEATVNDAYAVTNEWTTVTMEFTADGSRNFSLRFWGGPNAAFKQSFCLDDFVLIKK